MKISTVSKKVLASALSAAMVVAFAPAVALADLDTKDKVTIQFDTTGLTLQENNSALQDQEVKISTANQITLKADTFTNHAYKDAAKADVTSWYWDIDGDGTQGNSEIYTVGATSLTIDITATGDTDEAKAAAAARAAIANGSTIVLRPAAATALLTVDAITVPQKADEDTYIKFTNTVATGVSAADAVKAVLKDANGAVLSEQTVQASAAGDVTFTLKKDNEANKNIGQVQKSAYATGSYTVEFTNITTNKAMATVPFEVTDVKLASGLYEFEAGMFQVGQTFKAVVGQTVASQLTAAQNAGVAVVAYDSKENDKKTVKAYTSDGKTVATCSKDQSGVMVYSDTEKSSKVAAGMELAPVFEFGASADFKYAGGKLYAKAVSGDGKQAITYVENETEFKVEISGALSYTKTFTTDLLSETEVYDFGTAGAPAGTYSLKITATMNKGSYDEKTVVAAADDIVIAKVTYDAGEYGESVASKTIQNTGKLNAYAVAGGQTVQLTQAGHDADAVLCGWSLDGTKVVTSADKIAADATEIALTAVYHVKADSYKPAFTYADKTLTLSTDKGAGYKIYWGTTNGLGNEYTGPIAVSDPTGDTAANSYFAQVQGTNEAGEADNSSTIELKATGAYAKKVEDFAKAVLSTEASDSSKTNPKYYATTLTTGAADAKAAVNALGYAEEKDIVAKALEQKKDIIAQIAAYEKAVIDTYAVGVKQSDGTVKKANETQIAAAKAAIDTVLADLDIATGKDNTVQTTNKYNGNKIVGGTYKDTLPTTNPASDGVKLGKDEAGYFVAAINEAATDLATAATTYKADDVAAAEAVTAQLKAATTGEAAEAALAAYEALTADQKALVDTADVLAAHEVIDAAEKAAAEEAAKKAEEAAAAALVASQDKAAVNLVNNPKTKTVKLATAKKAKTTLTYKVKVSASGSLVTYAKVSGNAKITVGAAGKVTLKKVTKAGTYKAKVLVTCGAQTRTVTVKFVVTK